MFLEHALDSGRERIKAKTFANHLENIFKPNVIRLINAIGESRKRGNSSSHTKSGCELN